MRLDLLGMGCSRDLCCHNALCCGCFPAAVDASEFEPNPGRPRPVAGGPITVVALSRLVYRKGIDILALVIPEICHRHPNVNFIIGVQLQALAAEIKFV